jgi:membrane protein YqaA with SNARE-associated domain
MAVFEWIYTGWFSDKLDTCYGSVWMDIYRVVQWQTGHLLWQCLNGNIQDGSVTNWTLAMAAFDWIYRGWFSDKLDTCNDSVWLDIYRVVQWKTGHLLWQCLTEYIQSGSVTNWTLVMAVFDWIYTEWFSDSKFRFCTRFTHLILLSNSTQFAASLGANHCNCICTLWFSSLTVEM